MGIDLDNVVDPKTGYIVPEAKNIVTDLDSYTEDVYKRQEYGPFAGLVYYG